LKTIIQYIRNYLRDSDKIHFIRVTIFCALLIFLNYQFQLSTLIGKNNSYPVKLLLWTGVFMVALVIPVLWKEFSRPVSPSRPSRFYLLLLIAPLLFGIKYTLDFRITFTADSSMNQYWNSIIYWPLLLLIVIVLLLLTRHFITKDQSDFGTGRPMNGMTPYFLMLLFMLPLIMAAAYRPDFQSMYPKLESMTGLQAGAVPLWKAILFEISYGTDFITIELFFRGFLVLSLANWLGKDAILPVAVFYCSIHFGKPLAECISSYFGGILLGIIVYHTRSIRGGLLVHLGIAWMMEIAGMFISR